MPYAVRQTGQNEWSIVRTDTGKVVGKSKTKKDAEASVRARYMAEHKK
jgi:hypothetical protein